MVKLYQSGKPRAEVIKEYDLSPSAFDRWVTQSQTTGSLRECDNRSEEQHELTSFAKKISSYKWQEVKSNIQMSLKKQ